MTYDAIRFAHRLVGPLYRFRKTMQAIAAGEQVAPVQLRKGDLLVGFQDDFNEHALGILEKQGYVLSKNARASVGQCRYDPVSGRLPNAATVTT